MAETWKKIAFYDEVATDFVGLSDTPADYTDDTLKLLRVNVGETAVEFVAPATVVGGSPPQAHKDLHDPEDGSDPLDCAAAAEIASVQAAAEGSAHSLARSDHAHAINHGITDNHIVTIDGTTNPPANTELARFTTLGLEGRTPAEVAATMALDDIGVPDADVSLNSHKITSLATPTATGDGATKGYVDGVATGLDLKESCRVATAAALPACTAAGSGVGKTLTINAVGILTVDGVATVLNDRILVKNQVTGTDNGIYKVTTEGTAGIAAVLTRATDFDQDAEVTAGAYSFIEEGTTLADQGWVLTTNNPITVDTTALVFGQFSSAGGTPAHKDTHDPNDGADSLDTAAAAEISTVVAAGVGTAHTFSRADHVHAINHGITDNHLVTIDGADIATSEIARFTANGLESRTPAEVAASMALDDIGVPDAKVAFNGQEAGDLCLENLAADPAVPVLGKVYFKTGDLHPYVCTAIA